MNEDLWTGPFDPSHNQFKFYCQNRKTNISIYSNGAWEIIRHYQLLLRKDQRWRFEHLSITDKVTGIARHKVRVKDGHEFTLLELEGENFLFKNGPLVDVGEKSPEYVANSGGQQTTEDQRVSAQIALLGNIIPPDGNILLIQTVWSPVGEYMNHTEQFSPFNWGQPP